MNDCLYCLIFGDKEHPRECLSINSGKGRERYEKYSAEIDEVVEVVQERWRKKLEKEAEESGMQKGTACKEISNKYTEGV